MGPGVGVRVREQLSLNFQERDQERQTPHHTDKRTRHDGDVLADVRDKDRRQPAVSSNATAGQANIT